MGRTALVSIVAPIVTIACAPQLVRMEPVRVAGQEVAFKDGAPFILSRAPRSTVGIAPLGSKTGRHELGRRVAFVVAIKNTGTTRVEVSEDSIEVSGGGRPANLLRAEDAENHVREDAVAASFLYGIVKVDPTISVAVEAQKTEAAATRDTATASAHVAGQEQVLRAEVEVGKKVRVVRLIQRNTIDPGTVYESFILVDRPRGGGSPCAELARPPEYGKPAQYLPAACTFDIQVTVGDESHAIGFSEVSTPQGQQDKTSRTTKL